jgi:hypothetical protein
VSWAIKNFPGDIEHYVVDETGRMVARVPSARRDDAELIAAMPGRLVALEAAARAVLQHRVGTRQQGLGYLIDTTDSRDALDLLAALLGIADKETPA